MMKRSLLYVMLSALLLLFACGGGSTVTAVSLEVEGGGNEVAVGGRTTLVAKATDSITETTLGEKVTFHIRHNESGSHLDQVNDRLDANGEARAIFYAGSKSGTDVIEASFESGARATTTLRVGDGVVLGNIRLEAFSQSGGGASLDWRIRATVTDTRNYPAPDVIVSFSTNNGNLELTEVATNNAGIAETILTLADTTQRARVWATAGGISVSIQVDARGPAPDPDPDPPAPVGTIQLTVYDVIRLQAVVRDTEGSLMNDVLVNFVTNRGNAFATRTNENGIALSEVDGLAPGETATVYAVSGEVRSNTVTVTVPDP